MKTPLDKQDTAFKKEEEPCWIEALSEELWMQVLSYIAPLELLQSVVHVSSRLHALLSTRDYWLFHLESLRSSPKDPVTKKDTQVDQAAFIRATLNMHQLQRLCLYCTQEPVPGFLNHGSRLVGRLGAERTRRSSRRRVCLATSTEHPTELLENVLSGRGTSTADEIFHNLGILAAFPQNGRLWWSSRPSVTQESQDTLLFATNCPLAVLSCLKVRPLLDPFTRGQVYSWSSAVVKAYRLPLEKLDPHPEAPNAGFPCTVSVEPQSEGTTNKTNDSSNDDDDEEEDEIDAIVATGREPAALKALLQNETPVYTSPLLDYTLPTRRCIHQRQVPWQRVVFPSTTLANVVTITLNGKNSKQFPHSGYYACVEQVQLEGIPLLKGVAQNSYSRSAEESEDDSEDLSLGVSI